jgi:glycosyltransferase involved in cell wall biosynthesis
VAQSNNTKENCIKYYRPKKNIDIIPLPYEPFDFVPATRQELGLKDDLFYTISVGRLIKRKGFDFLIRSVAQITDDKVHALVIGEGPELGYLQNLAQELGIQDRIHFVGGVSEEKKFQYLSNADVYVLSSVHEGYGIVLQEAMQVGLPIIATDNGGQVDFFKEGENAELVKFGDGEELAKKLQDAISRRINEINTSGANIYNPEVISRQMIELV